MRGRGFISSSKDRGLLLAARVGRAGRTRQAALKDKRERDEGINVERQMVGDGEGDGGGDGCGSSHHEHLRGEVAASSLGEQHQPPWGRDCYVVS